ncbi:hypothetical protein BU15DRAFT_60918 [Melanogaster broomeanus]|nr:hypothetical protein BU15DRAFT_60918 [Melanogaster broomeanus]
MSSPPQMWSPQVKIAGSVANGVAILVTVFRLMYRWYMSTFWWEDGWAAFALAFDIGCLVAVLMQIPPQSHIATNWILSLTVTCILWCARMSILCSIVRIANPSPKLRRVAYCIAALFLVMEIAFVAQKLVICKKNLCKVTNDVAITQLVTDVVSDAILIAAPVRFLRDVKLSRKRRILILSAFSASILITGSSSSKHPPLTLSVIGAVKAALSLLFCNSLVLVTFVYRVCHVDLDPSPDEQSAVVQFTSVVEMSEQGQLAPAAAHNPHGGALSTPTTNDPMDRTPLQLDENHALTELGGRF